MVIVKTTTIRAFFMPRFIHPVVSPRRGFSAQTSQRRVF
jgi:hypothetical protein